MKQVFTLIDSYYVVKTQSVEDTYCQDIDFQKNSTPNATDFLTSLNIYVEALSIESTKYKSSSGDSSQILVAQVVAIKAYFMNKIT